MKAYGFTRNGLILGGRPKKYETVIRYYLCNECGGRPVHKIVDGQDSLECGECGGRDFVSERTYLEQCAEAFDLKYHLPENLRALVAPPLDISAQDAIKALFD